MRQLSGKVYQIILYIADAYHSLIDLVSLKLDATCVTFNGLNLFKGLFWKLVPTIFHVLVL